MVLRYSKKDKGKFNMKKPLIWKSSLVLGVILGAAMMLFQMFQLKAILPEGFANLFSFLSCWLLALFSLVAGSSEPLMGLVPLLCFIGSAISGILIVIVCRVVINELVGALLEFVPNRKNKSGNSRKRP